MKLLHEGETERAICDVDGAVTVTYRYRDVPFSDGVGTARHILVGVCDVCGEPLAYPPQSTPAISVARQRAMASLEANIPASFVDVLDAAASRVDPAANTEFRKRLLVYYLNRYARGDEAISELAGLAASTHAAGPNKRLSFKLSDQASKRLGYVLDEAGLSKTQLLKGLIGKIAADLIKRTKPRRLAELVAIVEVLNA